jgi:hypothetical protein
MARQSNMMKPEWKPKYSEWQWQSIIGIRVTYIDNGENLEMNRNNQVHMEQRRRPGDSNAKAGEVA